MIFRRYPRTRSLPSLAARCYRRTVTTSKSPVSHVERTAAEPRDTRLHPVTLSQITQVNSAIRLLRLTPTNKEPIRWVDLYIPHLPSPGGFTLTSVPSTPDLELAVQRPRASSPSATPASWLWQPPSRILHTRLQVRVGGRFVWPPLAIPRGGIRRVVFVAGGVGINPLISMLTSIVEEEEEEERERIGSREGARPGLQVRFLYSVRSSPEGAGGGEVLFLSRLRSLCKTLGEKGSLRFFVTGEGEVMNAGDLSIKRRRMTDRDVEDALGDVEERSGTVCYVCGVPGMTDEFVEIARQAEGMDGTRVLSEKWW